MNQESVGLNSVRAWVLAARPKTLTAALIPVLVAVALAWADGVFQWKPALVCALFASLMQVAANLINDLFDYLKGTDRTDRLGPERACAQGWISVGAMRWGIALVVSLACMVGAILLFYGGWWLVGIGMACVVFAFLYTTLLSYCGLGDALVLVFFGLVPVAGTYYVQAGVFNWPVAWCALSCGLVVDTLLVVNNYRDRDTDRNAGKRTLIVLMGEPFGRYFYLLLGVLACAGAGALTCFGYRYMALPCLYLVVHVPTWRRLSRIRSGRALNQILGDTSRNMFIFAVLLAVALFLN